MLEHTVGLQDEGKEQKYSFLSSMAKVGVQKNHSNSFI